MTVSATTSSVWPLNNESTSGETSAAMMITITRPAAITPPVSAPRVTRAPGCDRTRDLLLEWLEEARRGGERDDPQHRQRAVAVAAEHLPGDGQEQVGRHAGDDQPEGDRGAPLRERVALAQPLAERAHARTRHHP